MDANEAPDIDRLYQECDPGKALPPGDLRYVSFSDFGDVRGDEDVVAQMARAIRRSASGAPLHLLFAGHRGAGKSTELMRLQDALAHPPDGRPGYFVVYFEADREDIDANDADFPDILLAIIRQVGKALRERAGEDLRPARLTRFVDDLKALMGSEVRFDELEWDLKIAKLTATIRDSPSERQTLRKALEPRVSSLIEAANDLLAEATIRLKAKGFQDLVLIVDNLDRIILRDVPGSPFNTHEQLFIHRGTQMTQIRCDTVYTLPISMVFSPRATQLTTVYKKNPLTLPMVKVVGHAGDDETDNPDGMKAMRALVQKRLDAARVSAETAFDSGDTLDYLCRMSGGHARNLLVLLCAACDRLDALPITRPIGERAVREMRNAFERALDNPAYFDVLRAVNASHKRPTGPFAELLLYNLSILEYVDDSPCFFVNPAVRLIGDFLSPAPTQDNTAS